MQENPLRPVTKRLPTLSADTKTDVLIVGGGITGVVCSYFLQKAGYKNLIVEMDEVGSGASGASSGVLYYGSGMNLAPSIKSWGADKAQSLWKETAQNIRELTNLIEKESLECGFRKINGIMVSKNQDQSKLLEEEKKELQKIGIKHPILSHSDLKQFYSGQKFESGLNFHNCSQIYPAFLASSLIEKFNLPVFEYTKMLSFESEKGGFIVNTSGGKVSCNKIIFATNDFPVPPEKSLLLEKNFKQESSLIVASQKLTPSQIKKFYPRENIIWTMDEDYDIIYPHEDRLILEVYRLQNIKEKLAAYYPGFEFTQELQWGSSWGRTSDWLPLAGEVQKNVFSAVATGDQGTTIGYTIAKNVVDMVEGKKNKFLEMANPKRFEKD